MNTFGSKSAFICVGLSRKAQTKGRVIVAIDGRCASGKTTMASELIESLGAEGFSCNLIHMDDFFLRPEQRTDERLAEPGGNIDHERFLDEVLLPLSQGKRVTYRPWDCGAQDFGQPITVEPAQITIVEGSYSCHPALWDLYDDHIFLWVSESTQHARILERDGEEGLEVFKAKWIPLEERYFSHYNIAARCEIALRND